MANREKRRKNHPPVIWAVALTLLSVVFMTLTLVAPMIWNVSEANQNIIPLFYTGDKQIVTQNTLQYIVGEEKPGVQVQDEEAVWELKTDVDLFASSYIGADGSVTVESNNGDKVIAPGTSQEYRFYLKNTGNISMDYSMELASVFSLESQSLPMKIRLRKGDEWMVGNETEWEKPESMQSVIEKGTLDVNNSVEYIFEWLWPYEDETDNSVLLNDLNDVLIANTAVEKDVKFQLEISTVSMVTSGARPVDEDGNLLFEPLVRWNVFSHAVLPSLLLLATVPFIIASNMPVRMTSTSPAVGETLGVDKKREKIGVDGRCEIKRLSMGKHVIRIGNATGVVKLKRKHGVNGVQAVNKENGQVLYIGRKVHAVDLTFAVNGNKVTVNESCLNATDGNGKSDKA